MPEKDQTFIFTKQELSLLKDVFADNDTLLYTIRKVLFQFPMTELEKGYIKEYISPEVIEILKKKLMPELGNEYPIGQLSHILMTLQKPFSVKQDEDMEWQFDAKVLERDYIKQQFALLEDMNAPQDIKLADMASLTGTPKERFVNTTAYIFLIGYIDPAMYDIKILAGAKEETQEEMENRITRDSAK